jgi:hypothetical protein
MDPSCRAAGRHNAGARGDPCGRPYSRKGGDATDRVNKEGRERERERVEEAGNWYGV